jgi:hypothetical protein
MTYCSVTYGTSINHTTPSLTVSVISSAGTGCTTSTLAASTAYNVGYLGPCGAANGGACTINTSSPYFPSGASGFDPCGSGHTGKKPNLAGANISTDASGNFSSGTLPKSGKTLPTSVGTYTFCVYNDTAVEANGVMINVV